MNERLIYFSKEPPTPAAPVLPPEGEDLEPQIFPLWGRWREATKGVLFSVFRVPRLRGERGGENRGCIPLTQPSPPRGRGLSVLALSLWERVGCGPCLKPLPHKPRSAIEAVIDGLSQSLFRDRGDGDDGGFQPVCRA